MNKSNNIVQALARSPFLWGALISAGFYGLVHAGVLDNELIRRYFASHPVEYVTTIMFFVGLAALANKALDITAEYRQLGGPLLGPIPQGGQPVSDCDSLAARLRQLPAWRHNDYLVRRVWDALDHVRRNGSADTLDDELKHLADLDAGRVHASYGLVRLIIWAIPILGFLGTVIGITLAIANLSPTALESSLPEAIAALSVAFNTTGLALGLSIVLMFAQFLTDREEGKLLELVDRRVETELVGRFERISSGSGGQLEAVRRMVGTLIESTEKIARRQADVWQNAIQTSGERWARIADAGGKQLQAALAGALNQSLKTHAQHLAAAEQLAAEKNHQHWNRVQQTLMQNVELLAGLQKGMTMQAETLGRAIKATGEVSRLEAELNRNLAALAGSKNFEQTVMSLAAAIHLLNARLGQTPFDVPHVQLEPDKQKGQAA